MPKIRTIVYLVAFVLFLLISAEALLTYTRRVDGTSMLPTLEGGDLVVIDNVNMSSINLGDIIVYKGPCSLVFYDRMPAPVIHRVVNITSEGFITKGDNNMYTDQRGGIASGPITQNCIEGKVVFVVPYIERLASLPDGLNYVLAALIIIAVVAYEFMGARGETNQPQTNNPAPHAVNRYGASLSGVDLELVTSKGMFNSPIPRCQLGGDGLHLP